MVRVTRFIIALSVVAVGAAFPVFAQDAAPVFAECDVASDDNVASAALCSPPYKDCKETGHIHYSKQTSSWSFLHKDANDPEYCWYRVTDYHYSCTKTWKKCRICKDCEIGPVKLPTICGAYGDEESSEDCRLIETETTTRRAECGRAT